MELDSFVGTRPSGVGDLEVIGICDSPRSMYYVKCHTCAKDDELFGDGVFKSLKFDLLRGFSPCGCSNNPRWSEEQYNVRISRACTEKKIVFVGFLQRPVRANTKVSLKCLVCGHAWGSSINNLLRNHGCRKCSELLTKAFHTKSCEEYSEKFMSTGAYPVGTKFWRDGLPTDKGNFYWKYNCPVCSVDEYVVSGLCSGIFRASSCSLLAGNRSCRCSNIYRWSKLQREMQIKRVLTNEGCKSSFVGWVTNSHYAKSKVTLSCHEHGNYNVSVTGFFDGCSRCRKCSKYGYNPLNPGSVYVLSISGGAGNFTGYGISNQWFARWKTHTVNLSKLGFKIDDSWVFKTSGQQALDIENKLKREFEVVPQAVSGFKTEATHAHLYSTVIDFIKTEVQLTKELND